MTAFQPREKDEPLAMHLHRNADALGVSVDQAQRLRHAAALCVRGSAQPRRDTEAGRHDRIAAGQMAVEVQKELRGVVDAAVMAATAQGEQVLPLGMDGAMRIKGRDGLWSLSESGGLTINQVETGLIYRGLYERVHASPLGSQLARPGEVRCPTTSTLPRIMAGLDTAKAGVVVTDIDSLVHLAQPDGMARRVLIWVAAEGHTVSTFAKGGHGRGKALAALRLALDVAAKRLAAPGGLRITGN